MRRLKLYSSYMDTLHGTYGLLVELLIEAKLGYSKSSIMSTCYWWTDESGRRGNSSAAWSRWDRMFKLTQRQTICLKVKSLSCEAAGCIREEMIGKWLLSESYLIEPQGQCDEPTWPDLFVQPFIYVTILPSDTNEHRWGLLGQVDAIIYVLCTLYGTVLLVAGMASVSSMITLENRAPNTSRPSYHDPTGSFSQGSLI